VSAERHSLSQQEVPLARIGRSPSSPKAAPRGHLEGALPEHEDRRDAVRHILLKLHILVAGDYHRRVLAYLRG
jgi:hypothetical protein